MVRPEPGDPGRPPQDVEVRVPAVPEATITLRAVAGDLASRAEFCLDAVADLRLAVDEASAAMVGLARPGTRLTTTFAVDEERITVTASVSTTGPTTLPRDTFGWRVLTTLAENVRVLAEAPDSVGDPHRLVLRLSVNRVGTPVS